MKINNLIFSLVICASICLTYACNSDDNGGGGNAGECDPDVSYASDVVPIIDATCAIPNCHTTNASIGDYTSYDDLKTQDDLGLLKPQIESGAMPPSNTAGPKELTDAQLKILTCWIEQGALNN